MCLFRGGGEIKEKLGPHFGAKFADTLGNLRGGITSLTSPHLAKILFLFPDHPHSEAARKVAVCSSVVYGGRDGGKPNRAEAISREMGSVGGVETRP